LGDLASIGDFGREEDFRAAGDFEFSTSGDFVFLGDDSVACSSRRRMSLSASLRICRDSARSARVSSFLAAFIATSRWLTNFGTLERRVVTLEQVPLEFADVVDFGETDRGRASGLDRGVDVERVDLGFDLGRDFDRDLLTASTLTPRFVAGPPPSVSLGLWTPRLICASCKNI
jgi:hypothetical protein